MTSQAGAGGLHPELRRQFIVLVAASNLAVLAVALGVLLVVFRSQPALGLALIASGLGMAALAWRRYRRVRDRLPLSR